MVRKAAKPQHEVVRKPHAFRCVDLQLVTGENAPETTASLRLGRGLEPAHAAVAAASRHGQEDPPAACADELHDLRICHEPHEATVAAGRAPETA